MSESELKDLSEKILRRKEVIESYKKFSQGCIERSAAALVIAFICYLLRNFFQPVFVYIGVLALASGIGEYVFRYKTAKNLIFFHNLHLGIEEEKYEKHANLLELVVNEEST